MAIRIVAGAIKAAKRAGEVMKEKYKDKMYRNAVADKISQTRQKTAKIKRFEYALIIERAKSGETHESIAKSYGCSRGYITRIINGKLKTRDTCPTTSVLK